MNSNAITVLTTQWEATHRRKPSGTGLWVFRILVHDPPHDWVRFRGGYFRASQRARQTAKERKSTTVTLMP